MFNKSTSKEIIIITSRENFIWSSMQEIIPFIEESWLQLAKKKDYPIHLINIDEEIITNHLKAILRSKLIVITCFNVKIARTIKIIREKFQIDTPIVFYLHGLATIGLWPLQRFDVLKNLTTNDIFIGTCQGDLLSMNLTLKNAHTVKIPFSIMDHFVGHNQGAYPFVFIGRLSPQKNLDHLILSYSKLDESVRLKHPLIFYGAEDHLGYPNVGLHEKFYLKKLQALVTELKLEKFIHFKGFVNRQEIQQELGSQYIFISPTTHSDENFGMSAFRALMAGAVCILTSWGGHKEFSKDFADSIFYLNPKINTNEMKEAMMNAIVATSRTRPVSASFTMDFITNELEKLVQMPLKEVKALIPTALAETIYKQQDFFEKEFNESQRCFYSFEDPAFIAFYQAYSN